MLGDALDTARRLLPQSPAGRALLAAGLVGFLALVWFQTRPQYVNYPPLATGPWIAYGDSLTAGTGGGPGQDYPTQLGMRLGVEIQNHGVPGDTSADGLARLPEALALNPRVVLLCLGGNDGLQGLPQAQALENIGEIISRFQAGGSFVVLIGVRSVSLLGDANEEGYRELAKEKGALYLPDILKGVLGKRSLMADQVHPNGEGYQIIASRVERKLRPHLDQIR